AAVGARIGIARVGIARVGIARVGIARVGIARVGISGIGLFGLGVGLFRLGVGLFGLGVGAGVLLLLHATKRDGAVPGRVGADEIGARLGIDAGDERQGVVVGVDRGLVLLAQELEVAGQVEGAGAQLERHALVVGDGLGGDEGAIDADLALLVERFLIGAGI